MRNFKKTVLIGIIFILINTCIMVASVYYENGIKYINEGNYKVAVEWFRKGAEQEHSDAQNGLGVCYSQGYGVSQDYEEAVKWFLLAAKQGNDFAQYSLGICYAEGNGVPQDYEEAVKWLCLAAEQGHPEAQKALEYLGY